MESTEATYAALLAVFNADSDTDGLNNASTAHKVNTFIRAGDVRDGRVPTRPYVVCDIVAGSDMGVMSGADNGPTPGNVRRGEQMLARLHVFTDRDRKQPFHNLILGRLRLIYDRVTMGSQVGSFGAWTFSTPRLVRTAAAPSSGKELHTVMDLSLVATYEPAA